MNSSSRAASIPRRSAAARTRDANRANGADGANAAETRANADARTTCADERREQDANAAMRTTANAGNAQAGASGERGARRNTRVLWQLVNGQLKPVRVHVGLSNATQVALIDGGLEEGAEVITGVAQTTMTSAQQPATNSPLMPSMPRRRAAAVVAADAAATNAAS